MTADQRAALAWLQADAGTEIADFRVKVADWMRSAVSAHLRRLFRLTPAQAEDVITAFLEGQP